MAFQNMNNIGKEKCELLKMVRQRIAKDNNIEYHPNKCSHKTCLTGSCPDCDSELKYLTEKLTIKQAMGEQVSLNIHELIDHFYG